MSNTPSTHHIAYVAIAALFVLAGCTNAVDSGPVTVEKSETWQCIIHVDVEDSEERIVRLSSPTHYYSTRYEAEPFVTAPPGGWVLAEQQYPDKKVLWNRSVQDDCSLGSDHSD